jgi:hypothetical protein
MRETRSKTQHLTRLTDFIDNLSLSVFFYSQWGETAATAGLWYQHQKTGDGDCGEIGGMKIGRGSRSTRKKPAPAPLLSTTIPT